MPALGNSKRLEPILFHRTCRQLYPPVKITFQYFFSLEKPQRAFPRGSGTERANARRYNLE